MPPIRKFIIIALVLLLLVVLAVMAGPCVLTPTEAPDVGAVVPPG